LHTEIRHFFLSGIRDAPFSLKLPTAAVTSALVLHPVLSAPEAQLVATIAQVPLEIVKAHEVRVFHLFHSFQTAA
jgi:hypothetical protein